ncbi:response regulator transcription factor [Clostridium sp. D2Q-11]|uniref:Response regulator transcription factor n=1 Tax=Anaeromonas frigoriresistens TaxID=2683708 RepID=A0A942UV45_9FIRM|nr:response regulator transcription factor [Anaeromonas frigoriresistens]MBS4537364.1 response regulator transcription factor [Anaeromonas frigoriresistens]
MNKRRVLIVDDEKEIADILRDFITTEGMEAMTAYNGGEAYEKFKSFSPSLVILDIMLPDNDGMEICRRIRNESDIPIIMLSAKDTDIDKIISLGLGADDYLTKPFSPAVVVAHVKAQLRRYMSTNRKSEDEDGLFIKNMKINLKKHLVEVDDKQIELVHKEFEILWLLASNAGTVFTKEQIYDEVWGVDEFGEIGTVTVHIRKLRTKIEADPAHPIYIKTIWGVGYKFDDG